MKAGRQPLSNVMGMTVEELHAYADGVMSTEKTKSSSLSSSSSSSSSSQQAVAWKDKGNVCFQNKDYQGAVDLYSRSIGCDPDNVSAVANRSMAYLKLGKYHECVEDCTLVLERDDCHVKSYLRRATARQHLGHMQGAIEDFEECIRREPYNSDAIQGRQESIASYLSRGEGLRAFPKHHIPLETSPETSPGPVVAAERKEHVLEARNMSPSKKVYKNGIEFEKDWRGCRGDSSQQAFIMESISPESIPVVLKQCLNPKMLYQITTAILSHVATRNPSHAVSLLTALTRTDRFSVNCMSFTAPQKKEVASLWNALDSKELISLQSLYHVL